MLATIHTMLVNEKIISVENLGPNVIYKSSFVYIVTTQIP